MDQSFGTMLRDWRTQRRLSQLALGLDANVSARHISFLETGRAKPSRAMVLQLCEVLDAPRGTRNSLLNAAGFAPAYRRRDLNEADMAQVRSAVDWTLARHDPYPALALDRHWTLVKINQSARLLLGAISLEEGDSLLSVMTDVERLTVMFENWQEVAQHMLARLRTESGHLGGDRILDAASDRLAESLGTEYADPSGVLPAVVPARYRAGEDTLSLFSTIAQFGTAEDIALAELKIELMFPADDATRRMLLAMTPGL
ncbi:helix-turn-helix transcriptional regulator [Denitrobaculum tricleocarpae]|uniref:Helix-turn-helix domain-containing protein n=1 Tax=Denitrobaculum tricleocarpae TaxID=2591009 RepID=A0A545T0G0_9PROT|nr:helix-turn-helix transcriptional regulator [Denitrobaculum tricleocarpae]TQV70659.1 helix-turn-helix domain-containing protein [Denitrobaculum tricleocarpae]